MPPKGKFGYNRCKLTDEDVKEIRETVTAETVDDFAERHDVNRLTIIYAAQGRTHWHLNDTVPPTLADLRLPTRKKKITDEKKEAIRKLNAKGVMSKEIANQFGISPTYVSLIVKGER